MDDSQEEKKNEEKIKVDKDDSLQFDIINLDIANAPFNLNIYQEEENFALAITGNTFETLWKLRNKYLIDKDESAKEYYYIFRKILQNGFIFARMSPDHKTILVECLREEKFTVLMCGDGANDCGALRAADVGVSLSMEEASIAAHFTSNKPDISCLIKLLREGKASLTTSIQTFKYMMMYSVVQFTTVTLLFIFNSYLSDNQFLAIDLFLILPLAFLIARTGAYEKLTSDQPNGALISVPIISSILLQTTITFIFQYGIYLILSYQSFFDKKECRTGEDDQVYPCQVNSAIFLVANFQYIISALVFSISKPFRKPIYSNFPLCFFVLLCIGYSIYIIIKPDEYSKSFLDLESFPKDSIIPYLILIINLVNYMISYFIEKSIIPAITEKYRKYKCRQLIKKIKNRNVNVNLNQVHKIRN